MFVAGLALFVAASVACALAKTAGWLIAARAIQGAGAALIMPLAMALLSAAYPPEERAKALGMFGGITGLALIVGPILGGVIAEGAPWQWIFWINLPIGLILIPFALRRIPESFGPATAIDGVGVVIVTGAAFGLVWALMRGNESGWKSFEVALASGAGLLLALGFVFWEIRTSHPMVPMRFFRSQAFSSGIAASVLFYAGMYGVVFFLPQYFQSAQGHGPLAAGLRLLPWTATLFVLAPIAGRLVNSIGEKSLIVVGLGLQAVGFAWIGLIAEPELPYFKLVLPLIIAGAGVSMAMPAAQNAVLNSVAKPEIGKASGIFNMFRFLGGVSGIALDVAVFSAVGGLAAVQSFSTGFATAIGASALLSLGGLSPACGSLVASRRCWILRA